MSKAETKKEETYHQKELRLKARKQIYKMTYKKGVFMHNHEALCKWIMQQDVVLRINSGGLLDDDTEFVQLTIEGFKAD